jgi:multiple sugar transport system substrate-binding protein
MKERRKFLWLAVILVVSLAVLISCGKKEASSGEASGPIELTFYDAVWGPQTFTPTAKKFVESYGETHPGFKVSYTSIPWESWAETFVVAASSNTLPDACSGAGFQQHQYAAQDLILSLDPIIEQWEKEGTADDFPEGYMDFFKYEGVQVGIPLNIDARAIYYRRDWFERDGISEPKTWDDFRNAAVHFAKNDNYGFAFGVTDGMGEHTGNYFFLSAGGGIYHEDGSAYFDNPRNIEALKWLRSFLDLGAAPPGIAGYNNDDAVRLYLQGKLAIYMGTGDFISMLEQNGNQELMDGTDIMHVMTGPHGDKSNLVCLNAVMAHSTTKYPQETLDFVKWYSESNLVQWTEGGEGPYPARISFWSDPHFTESRLRQQMLDRCIPYSRLGVYPLKSATLSVALVNGEGMWREATQAAMTGENIEAFLKKQNQRLAEYIEELGS